MAHSILVFRIGQLGDSLIALPSLWAVRKHFPGAKITLLCDSHPGKPYVQAADLFANTGVIDDFETYPVCSQGPGRMLRAFYMGALLARLRGKFDSLVYLAPSGRTESQVRRDYIFFKAAGIKNFYGMAGFSAGAEERRLVRVEHEADHLMSRLALSGIPIPLSGHGCMDLNLGENETNELDMWLAALHPDEGRPWVGFGPGSKMPAKKWQLERYAEVGLKLIRGSNVWPVVFGGREDAEVGNLLLKHWGAGYNAAGKLSLRASALALKRCALYVGNDTGTMHLAAAAGTKCVGIFSARDWPGRWDPYGTGHKVFRANVECEGCFLTECLLRKNECLERIDPQEVLASCEMLLGSSLQEDLSKAI